MLGFWILITLLLHLLDISEPFEMHCNYENVRNFWTANDVYACNVTNNLDIISIKSIKIQEVTGTHLTEMSNGDPIFLYAQEMTIHYFPHGLENFFSNINGIVIKKCGMKEIHQADLKPFPTLKVLDLDDNEIEVLENGVFDYNNDLIAISLAENRLIHIGQKVFEKTLNLVSLNLWSNNCTRLSTIRNPAAVFHIIKNLERSCYESRFEEMGNELRNLEELSRNVNHETYQEFRKKLYDFDKEYQLSIFLKYSTYRDIYENVKKIKAENIQSTTNTDLDTQSSQYVSRVWNERTCEAKNCCRLEEFQSRNVENFEKISNSISQLKNSQSTSFVDRKFQLVNDKILSFDGRLKNIDEKIAELSRMLQRLEGKLDQSLSFRTGQ